MHDACFVLALYLTNLGKLREILQARSALSRGENIRTTAPSQDRARKAEGMAWSGFSSRRLRGGNRRGIHSKGPVQVAAGKRAAISGCDGRPKQVLQFPGGIGVASESRNHGHVVPDRVVGDAGVGGQKQEPPVVFNRALTPFAPADEVFRPTDLRLAPGARIIVLECRLDGLRLLDGGRGREIRQVDLPSAQRMLERDGLAVEFAADPPRGKGQAVPCGGCPVGGVWMRWNQAGRRAPFPRSAGCLRERFVKGARRKLGRLFLERDASRKVYAVRVHLKAGRFGREGCP